MKESLQIAVDTGGTFTDVAIRGEDGSLFVWKVPSTPDSPDDAVIDGVTGAIEELGADITSISQFVHGTTVATNTVITRTGARVGLVTTAGFRDMLTIGHQARPSLYDQHHQRSKPLVPDELISEVSERVSADATIIRPVERDEIIDLATRIRARELDVLVVSFLNAFVNPENERNAVAILKELGAAPEIFAASSISTEMREYERTSTGTINAYVQPKIAGYVGRLAQRIREIDVSAPLWIMQSNGGLLTPDHASEHAARTALSGLAGGVVGSAMWADQLGLDKAVSFDIGGTSTDIALIRDGQPDETMAGQIDDLPLQLPSVDVHTIGAGGGSIAWLDSGGGLRVGPQSAGAVPGPVCYRRGGLDLTVTDAHAVLGRLGSSLLGGRFELDLAAARQRMTEWGDSLGLSTEDAAEGILRVINATMARGIRKVSVERGVDVRNCALIAFGGAGPLHGSDLLRELDMKSAVIPPMPGIASAVGMLDAPERHDFSSPVDVLGPEDHGSIAMVHSDLATRAESAMDCPDPNLSYLVDARYVGQSYELTIPYVADWESQRKILDSAHAERYGFSDASAEMEIVVARLVARGEESAKLQSRETNDGGMLSPVELRQVYIQGSWKQVPVYERADLSTGTSLCGPFIVNQLDSTTYVGPDQLCRVDEFGFMHLTEGI
ncbi:hydantoinase/oxoprolinase family protein [Brevibacterium aurantiacum]|uniref:Hydantoinase/oxoprolinase family protein n=1 Tax=Brevibacterium aurantiacum TaxID=273384 RepID=A0A4Z0KGE7_BREAU|nr:hydantoinase/oxoprolinase family protein [Brevibacterium aurantiacum]TGD36506.1 hydantoinase/oxoprolinase family protein [Brevibacterium aurantiacum]